jgi:alpha-L-rhamnosidase
MERISMTRTVPNAARYIFNEPTGRGRNRYVLFRKAFDLQSIPSAAQLHLFADTRYRLIINGATVSHGPARFFKNHPEYDTHEIAAHLRPGRNVIAVVVNVLGGVTFQNEAGQGALIVWADIPGTVLVSDTSWKALESPGHRADTHTMSFAIGPAEQCDARRLPVDWFAADFDDSAWPAAQLIDHAGDYAGLSPRSIALLDEREVVPERFLGAFEGRPGEEDWTLGLEV